ncbi:MAG TPA: sugar MFS transporter [Bryobacteraceae bacterium]|nr:sugar MFS transporter [Bryobacteraceae bacterium]
MSPPATPARRPYLVAVVLAIFFVIALLTNILGPIIPDIIHSFHLNLTAAGFLPFAFFIAYGVASIPAGMLVEWLGEKKVILGGFGLAFAGALLFACVPAYQVAITSLFLIGVGMALLQVAINPLLRVAGGSEHFAFNATLSQLVFGCASFISPLVYSYLVRNLESGARAGPLIGILSAVVPRALAWVSVYWVLAVTSVLMIGVLAMIRFPRVERQADEIAGSWATHQKVFRNPVVLLFFLSTFFYVGAEQGTANWMSQFLATYHHRDPQTTGALAVSWYWGLMTAGCVAGALLMKRFDSRRVLIGFSCVALTMLTVAIFGTGSLAVWAFPLVGLGASAMWPAVISLGLNSVSEHHGTVSGILCTGIAGGAVVPLSIGYLSDHVGLRGGILLLYLAFGWVLGIGFWANPIVANKTT